MLDLSPVWQKQMTIHEFCAAFTQDDLRRLTNEMIDHVQHLIADATDADVVFEPEDPEANDPEAATTDETNMPWTLGHVIVHTTAGSEESAFLAAEMARGVPLHGRSRYETPWQHVKTIDQVRARLEESRRMRLATLDVWPDKPHLDNTIELGFLDGPVNAIDHFVVGLGHEASHLAQIEEIMRQAKAARGAA